jgi:hypothetical protein
MTDRRKLLVQVIERRFRSGGDGDPDSVARRAYDELAADLIPLVSESGFDALMARALQLAQREFPAGTESHGDEQPTRTIEQVSLWLERQDQRKTIAAAAAMFEALAALITTLIGESLTTRYLRKAWPEDSSAERSNGGKS